MSRRKLAFVAIAVALAVGVGVVAWAQTWIDRTLNCTCTVDCIADLQVYDSCDCTVELADVPYGLIHSGNWYHFSVYIRNIGTEGLWVTYDPGGVFTVDTGVFWFAPVILEWGTVCQLTNWADLGWPAPLPMIPYNPGIPAQGIWLNSGEVIKVDIALWVQATGSMGTPYAFPITFYGCVP